MTQGSPIRQLFVPFFPEYFNLNDLYSTALGCDGRWSWVNFYRDTDYIGKHLFAVPQVPNALPTPANPADVRLLDPHRPRLPLRRHIDYEAEPLVQEWLARVATDDAFRPARPSPEPDVEPTESQET